MRERGAGREAGEIRELHLATLVEEERKRLFLRICFQLPPGYSSRRVCALSSTLIGIISSVTSSYLREWGFKPAG